MFKEKVLPHIKRLSKRWFIDAFGGMAQGLFATLIIGTIIEQIGKLCGENAFGRTLQTVGIITQRLMGAGIGAGIAHALKANKLIIFSAAAAGFIGAFAGANYVSDGLLGFYGTAAVGLSDAGKTVVSLVGPGNPIGAYLAAIIAVEAASLVAGKTKVDIILLPLITIITAAAAAVLLCPPVISAVNALGGAIAKATELQPFLMGVVVSVVMGLLLTLPTSSAAMWVAIAGGAMAADPNMRLAGGAAVVGCAAHMVGFAVASFRENRFGGLVAQGIGTSMLQIPNLMRKPVILIPAVAASAIVGPLSTCVFKLYCSFEGGGMGTSGLVGVISTITASSDAGVSPFAIFFGIALLFFIIPAAVAFFVSELMRKKGIIKFGDMKI
ncbi:MAG: PTS sugar transporter subunit IIC [Clostridiales bacterium]|nr:PTS sugar transporter subunit IIC [Clostridiales bacterium]